MHVRTMQRKGERRREELRIRRVSHCVDEIVPKAVVEGADKRLGHILPGCVLFVLLVYSMSARHDTH